MSKKKDVVKGGLSVPRVRENSRLMRTHESIVDYINGRHPPDIFLNALLGLDLRSYDFQNDIIYSSDDDDDEPFYPHTSAYRPLEPHPRITQLTDEEAEKHAKELIAEEERRKEKTEKNKRKKMRKKEKKRLEKENAAKDILPEEEQAKSDSSENLILESNVEANEFPKCGNSQNGISAAACNKSNGKNKKENLVKMNKKEEKEQKDLDLNNSNASTAKSVPEETCNQKPVQESEKKTKLAVQKPKTLEKMEVEKKKEDKHELNKEKTVDPTVEEYAKRSRELAGTGNRLAASGQYEVAVKCFTDAIKFNPKEYRLFGNRSLCYERMQQYENALRDADVALSMEPNWIKGLFRKGKALCGLKKYYEASLIYKEVLNLDSSSAEATQELKRAQTLHLMEMGFNWAQCTEALKTHSTLEEAVEALFGGDSQRDPGDAGASWENTEQPVVEEEEMDEGEWTVQVSRPRMQQVKDLDAVVISRSKSQSPTPHSKNSVKPELFSIWVGSLAPTVTYAILHELFSRVGVVYGIKMLLEHQCAFVNYTKKEDCDRAIQCFNGMVVEGAPLAVRYPSKGHNGLGPSGSYKKECFFWRTTGCTRPDCSYRHVPEHKNIDREKFTSRLGHVNM
ncbi:stress-induced-phosphoprotein 1 [Echeneis naucrates]|uniref:Stress-induced-phosphoprotein 1-like n=1 Tax=Echeneis naucrates TaxID=173247 RepID=A0A665WVZ3_ECHNA|nr:stress-induced-phosphoprotein 1-like [Echeneis naucrates]